MFNLKLNDAKFFSNATNIISDFIAEASFKITKEGFKLVAMDPANISMVILNILPSAFTEYKVEKDEEITVNVETLKMALKRAKPTDSIMFTADEGALIISLTGKTSKKFKIPLLEKEGGEKNIPSLNFNAELEIDANEFKDYIEDASVVSDALIMNATKEKVQLIAGEKSSKVEIDIGKDSKEVLVNMDVKEESKSIYSIEYLKKISKAATISDTALIKFSQDYPLRLDFKSLNQLQMSFILAPRIENQ